MKKIIALLIAVLLLLTACSSSTMDGVGIVDSDNKYVKMVKGGHREGDDSITYEKAFSAFFGTPRWNYINGEGGQNVVEFTGDCTYMDVSVKARIQFVVDEENGTFDATYLAFNEVPQNMLTLAAIIEKAFEGASTAGGEAASSNTENQILLWDVTLQNITVMSKAEVIRNFGEPDIYNDDYYGVSSIQYGTAYPEIVTFAFDLDGNFKYIDGNAVQFTYKGQSLSQDEYAITALLGKSYDEYNPDRYFNLETWFWGDYSLMFMFPNGEDGDESLTARSISVEKMTGSDDMTTDNDIYSNNGGIPADDGAIFGFEDDYEHNYAYEYNSAPTVDSELVGRWRSSDGGMLEFDSYGTLSTVGFKCWTVKDTPYYISCYTDNGRVYCTSYFDSEYTYDFKYYQNGKEYIKFSNGAEYDRGDGETGSVQKGLQSLKLLWSPEISK